jgi:hypothetical protein
MRQSSNSAHTPDNYWGSRMSRLAILILIFSLGLTESSAQEEGQGELQKCVSMPEDAARLACFDAYAARVRKQDSASLKAKNRQAETATPPKHQERQENFGLTNTEIARREAQAAEQETQSNEVASVPVKAEKLVPEGVVAHVEIFARLKRSNNIHITLDNGQIWQEIDGSPFRGSVKPGTEVRITERRFGGYQMKIPGRSSPILVRRIK